MTSPVAVHGVRILGEGVPYLDGAEDELYTIISEAADRSTDSDELAGQIHDWPTRYHLSRLRRNLLMPLRITEGMRVLDVGCGTGALTRRIAELGAEVTGLEGSLARSRVAAARTAGLSNCDVVSGSLEEYVEEGHRGEFDIVLLCGVLEYSGSAIGGRGGPTEMLDQAKALVKPDGVVALAIENQLGLKYLLSYPEDHRGLPWVGVDGYRSGRNPAQTWSREQLGRMLDRRGLTRQRWLFPFPDYKLPTMVVDADLYGSDVGRDLLRLFLRNPVVDHSASAMLTADAVGAFQTMLSAGMGADTANSFLVLAGAGDADPAAHLRDGSLWMSSNERAAEFMDYRVLRQHEGGLRLESVEGSPEVHIPPLVFRRSDIPVTLGSNLEDEIVAAASRATSPEDLQPLIAEWWTAAQPWVDPVSHGTGFHLDVVPRNFIRRTDGELVYVDRELLWEGSPPVNWPLLRAMWYLVQERLWPAGAAAGLSWRLTVGEAAFALARIAEPGITPDDVDRAVEAEAALQARVSGADEEALRGVLRGMIDRPLLQLQQAPPLAQFLERPLIVEEEATQRVQGAELERLQAQDEARGLAAEAEALRQRIGQLEAKLSWMRSRTAQGRISSARRVGGKVKRRLAR